MESCSESWAKDLLMDTDWLLVGALARDYAFRESDDLKTLRATTDVDLAALLESWEEFDAKVDVLCNSGSFSRTRISHRLMHTNGQLMDFIPFGGMENKHHILWPPDGEAEMNVMGFRDVLAASESISLPGELSIRIATPASVGLLKLIAWHDKPSERQRDIEDIAALVKGYITEIVGWEDAYRKYESTMAAEDFDLDESGAYILGLEMANILSSEVYSLATQAIGHVDGGGDRLVSEMRQYFNHSFDHAQRICHQLIDGFKNRRER